MIPLFRSQLCKCGCGESLGLCKRPSEIKRQFLRGHNRRLYSPLLDPDVEKKARRSYKGKGNPFFGKHFTDESLRKLIKARGAKPNKLEKHLSNILQQSCPNEWKYVGDGEVIIGGKCPDFLNTNGRKQVIEFMGNYWHPLFDGANRIDHYRQYGFECLVIWQDELKDIEKLNKKIKKFAKPFRSKDA